MSKFVFSNPVAHLPILTEYQMSGADLSVQMGTLALEKYYLWDYNFWYVSLMDWSKVMKDVAMGMPKYTVDKFDCENFAVLTAARVSERYKLNTCGIAIGQSPWGEHGYNILVTETGFIYYEPQTGDFIEIADGSYAARLVIFG
uniref:Agglutinin C-terminal domain-containing protein n=1 Tax=viral metagenome TaxID=1070528 RepID=A0A6M3IY14_9ZZZZ